MDFVTERQDFGTLKTGEVFVWNIPGYVLKHQSQKFSDFFTLDNIPGVEFCLMLYPHVNSSDTISLNLRLHRITLIQCDCCPRNNSENTNSLLPELDVRFVLYKSGSVYRRSCPLRMKEEDVMIDFPNISDYDSMTIQCTLMSVSEICKSEDDSLTKISHSKSIISTPGLSAFDICRQEPRTLAVDMSALLNSGSLSDVTLCVEDKEFSVHRCILAARSNVFAAMFSHDTRENREKRVVIADFSSGVIQQLLKYIYTDQTDKLTTDQCLSLYSAADKYAMVELRKKCSRQLMKHLPLNSVIHVLVTADFHQDDELKEAALQMFLKNAVSVMSCEDWMPFLQNHTQLASSILMHLAKKSGQCN